MRPPLGEATLLRDQLRVIDAVCNQHPQRGAVECDPEQPHQHNREQDPGGRHAIFPAHVRVQLRPDRPHLHADQHEGEHVEHEHRGLPHRIGRHPQPRRDAGRRRLRDGNGVDDDGEDTGEAEMLGGDPDHEGGGELHDDRARHLPHAFHDGRNDAPRKKAGQHAADQSERDRGRDLATFQMLHDVRADSYEIVQQ